MNILKTEIPMFLFKNEHYIIKISYRMYVYTIIHPIIYHTRRVSIWMEGDVILCYS